jgi:ParB family transcriptional regulator, chromosome partitioning protein
MALQKDGKLPKDHTVPCQLANEEKAVELSLAENTVREAMHPLDEYEAFAKLIEAGATAEQVAIRFGKTDKHVLQPMRLARVAPAYGPPSGNAPTSSKFS